MANKKELELERQSLLLDMAGKIDVIFDLLTRAVIEPQEEQKNERKNSKKTKKTE